jgi:cytoskeletal protein RodZ
VTVKPLAPEDAPVPTSVPPAAVTVGRAPLVAGELIRDTVIVEVSPDAAATNELVTILVTAVPTVADDVAEAAVKVSACPIAALEGATDITPKPNAATATSATRLKVVFVDICFLSIVDPRTIPDSAWIVFRPSSR